MCAELTRLSREYAAATRAYSEWVKGLTAAPGRTAFIELMLKSEEARLVCEHLRTMIEHHRANHDC